MKKRMLALLLCLCMAATFLPGTAGAASTQTMATSVTIVTYSTNENGATASTVELNANTPYYVNGEVTGSSPEPQNWTAFLM